MLDDDKKDLRENVLVMINDVVVPNAKYVVKDGETITFLIAVDGG
jgi:sulfur carrier protein ThiS